MPFPEQVERWRALIRKHAPPELRGDSGFEQIVLATIAAESGGNPAAVGDQGASVGLFQLHERGMGQGLTRQQRSDPDTNASRAVAALARAYRQTGGNPAETYRVAINPGARHGRPQITSVMRQYQSGGGKVLAKPAEQAGGQMEAQAGKPTAEREKLLAQQQADLETKRAALTAAEAEYAQAQADASQTDDGELNLAAKKKLPGLKAKVSGLQSQVRAAESTVARTSGQIATAKDSPPGAAASQKPSVSTGAGTREKKVLVTKADGTTEWIDNPNYVDPATEAMTPAEAAADARQGEQIDLGWANNALGWVREQIARGTLDFNRGKQFVDYILKDQGPIEENGKLYQKGLNPEHPDVKFFGLTPREYKAIDYAKALGDPSLNQAVRSNDYAFGNAGITPQQWKDRAFGLEAQAQVPAQTGEQPAPDLPQKGFIPGGGAQPQAPTFMGEGDPMRPQGETPAAFSRPTFGEGDPMRPQGETPSFGGLGTLQTALDADIARTRDHLIKLGTSPQIAEQAARQFFMRQGAT